MLYRLNPLHILFVAASRTDLVRQIEYLKVENQILRAKLGRQVKVTAKERQRPLDYWCASSLSTITPSGRNKGWRIERRSGQVRHQRVALDRSAARVGSVDASSTTTAKQHETLQIIV